MKIRDSFLPIAIPDLTEEEIYEVIDCIKSGWISVGPKVREFERKFSEWHGVKHSIAVSSCTTALFIAAKVAGVKEGDYVIVPTITWQSTANIVEQLGAIPLFADVEKDSMNIKNDDVLNYIDKFGDKIKVIIPVHMSGLPVDIEFFENISAKYGITIIFDGAHAVFSQYKGKMVGQFGKATCFSFYATKNLTTGDGGIITTNDDEFAEQCRIWSYHGLPKDSWKRYSSESSSPHVQCIVPGYKFNLTDLQAALGLAQLKRKEYLLNKRNELFYYYNKILSDLDFLKTPVIENNDGKWGNHVYVVKLLDDKINRDELINELRKFNIGTNIHFYPVHLNLYYKNKYPNVHLPNSEWLKDHIISLPLCTKYSFDDLDYVAETIKFLIKER